MAFFMPYNVRHAQDPLASLLRAVEDLNTSSPRRGAGSRCGGGSYAYRPAAAAHVFSHAIPRRRPWVPSFEAQETEDAYILRGELPGLNRDHVTLEFPEAQKLVVSGKVVERTEATNADNQTPAQDTAPEAEKSLVDDNATLAEETESRSSFQATVEDGDDDDFEVVSQSSKTAQEPQEKPQPEAEEQPEEQQQQQQPAQERVSRQFSRSFTFPVPVEYDFVTASLTDGLLEVVVPKARHQPHHVTIN